MLRLQFHQIGSDVCCVGNPQVVANERFAFFIKDIYRRESSPPGGVYVAGMVATLRDERIGQQRVLSPPGCSSFGSPMFGGPWLMLDCFGPGGAREPEPAPELYDLSNGRWTSVALAPAVQAACKSVMAGAGDCETVGVGAHWLKFKVQCYHCTATYILQNIQTGATRRDPASPGGRVFDDLDSVSGASALCPPLRYPSGRYGDPLGRLEFYGSFALALGYVPNQGFYDYAELERCGSKLRVNLPGKYGVEVAANDHAVVWEAGSPNLGGTFLPSLRRLSIPLPTTVTQSQAEVAALSGHTLYVLGGQEQLWAAAIPNRP